MIPAPSKTVHRDLLMLIGIAGLILPFVAPYYAFGLLWVGVTFLLDPSTIWRDEISAGHLLAGDWRFFVLMPLAALLLRLLLGDVEPTGAAQVDLHDPWSKACISSTCSRCH